MRLDLHEVTQGWPYEQGKIKARWIEGCDGLAKVQIRLDLGILQMDATGRPDGKRPHGCESELHYFLTQKARSALAHTRLTLDEEDCDLLQQEAVQYYYRYLAFSALENHEGVVDDTEHTLAILRLVEDHAPHDLAWPLLQFYPYVCMMKARAQSAQGLLANRPEKALEAVRRAQTDIWSYLQRHVGVVPPNQSELLILQRMANKIRAGRPPPDPRKALQDAMAGAIAEEDYERAAILRDRLKQA